MRLGGSAGWCAGRVVLRRIVGGRLPYCRIICSLFVFVGRRRVREGWLCFFCCCALNLYNNYRRRGRYFGCFSCVGAVVGCRSRRLFTGVFELSHETCGAAVQSVEWGLLIGDCVVWVHADCWVVGGAVVFSVRHTAGCSSIIYLHLLFFKLLVCVPV